ncbi:MAG: YihY/virulence factor BrkB family protein, partial [Candidatus Bathyarchaeota archaeon]|nr:YihY/virulence factor BrkB family protein [Candidatus Bathyarchaeota archaeon]
SSALSRVTGTFAASAFFFIIQLLFSFASAVLLFAIVFKQIPDVKIEWGEVWIGAVITGVAFVVLNNVFGFYLRAVPVTTVSGVAGSLIFLLLWIFVIAEVLIYGAHFSKCYAETLGSYADRTARPQQPSARCVSGELAEAADLAVEQKEELVSNVGVERAGVVTPEAKPHGAKGELLKEKALSVKAEEKLEVPEPSAEVKFEQLETADSGKEYRWAVKWKPKKKAPSREKESSGSAGSSSEGS